MTIWGISDLHLSFAEPVVIERLAEIKQYKPMSVFGEHWQNHPKQLYDHWQRLVAETDVVLLPGDLSWGMNLEDCMYDFDFLNQLKGQLILSKGNHDYWWDTKRKVMAVLPPNVRVLQNETVLVGDIAIGAVRGWLCPGSKEFSKEDEKIYKREVIRLELALKAGENLAASQRWVMFHFRPVNDQLEYNQLIALLQTYGVTKCVYGHLHGSPVVKPLLGVHWGIEFQLISCDYLGFKPLQLTEHSLASIE